MIQGNLYTVLISLLFLGKGYGQGIPDLRIFGGPQNPSLNVNVTYQISLPVGGIVDARVSTSDNGVTIVSITNSHVTVKYTSCGSHNFMVYAKSYYDNSPHYGILYATVQLAPPSAYNQTHCGNNTITLSASSGYTSYEWYDNRNNKIATSTSNQTTVPASGLTAYKVKGKKSSDCWSGYSNLATITNSASEILSDIRISGDTYCGSRGGYLRVYSRKGFSNYHGSIIKVYKGGKYITSRYIHRWLGQTDRDRSERNRIIKFGPYYASGSGDTYTVKIDYNDCKGIILGNAVISKVQSPFIAIRPSDLTYNVCETDDDFFLEANKGYNRYIWYRKVKKFNDDDDFFDGRWVEIGVTSRKFYPTKESFDYSYGKNYYKVSVYSPYCGGGYITSYPIRLQILKNETPSLKISGPMSACNGKSKEFTVTNIKYAGQIPTYVWKVNGIEKSRGSSTTWSTSTLKPGDRVSADLISSRKCVTQKRVSSNNVITMDSDHSPQEPSNKTFTFCPSEPLQIPAINLSNTQRLVWYDINGNIVHRKGLSSPAFPNISPGEEYIYQLESYSWYGCRSSTKAQIKIKLLEDGSVCNDRLNWIQSSVYDLDGNGNSVISRIEKTYYDGLGRPIQNVNIGGSPLGKDIVTPISYDAYGRQATQNLPYATTDRSGTYRSNTQTSQRAFYQSANDAIPNDNRPFSETIYEPSPLNRVHKQYGPGEDWKLKDKAVSYRYEINQANEVKLWKIIGGLPVSTEHYESGQLYKNVTIDEQGHQVIAFVDKHGRTVLKRVQANDNASQWADTYYLYDDLGNLRYILPPEAMNKITTDNLGEVPPGYTLLKRNYTVTTSTGLYMYLPGVVVSISPTVTLRPTLVIKPYRGITQEFLDRWAFQYKYDRRKRMIEKKVPGAGAVYMVYDKRDRLVLTQDAQLRQQNQWIFTKYDHFNRPVSTGTYTNTTQITRATLQTHVDSQMGVPGNSTWYESRQTTAGNVHGYDNASFPKVTNLADYLTITYYDDYGFKNNWGTGYRYSKPVDDPCITTNATYCYENEAFIHVKGLVTGSKVKNLSDNSWLKSVTYYDDRYRAIQTVAQNHKGGIDRTSNLYDFMGKVLQTRTANEGMVNMVANGGGSGTTDWVDTNTDGFGDGWTVWNETYGGNRSIVTGNGFVGNAQRVQIPSSGRRRAIIQYIFATNAGKTYRYSFKYRSNITLRVVGNTALNTTTKRTLSANTGNAVAVSFEATSNGNERGIFFDTSSRKKAGDWFEIDEVTAEEVLPTRQIKTTKRNYTYDHAGRLLSLKHQLDNHPQITLINNEYNELGQLIDKKLHSTDGTTFEQSIDYRHNIRGWLTSINDAALSDGENDLFGLELGYNTDIGLRLPTAYHQYNGNISAVKWSGEQEQLGYGYTYDAMNRLKTADHRVVGVPNATVFDVNGLTYDLNGNIKTLTRYDRKGVMDRLTYRYGTGQARSNQLLIVGDTGTDKGFKDGNTSGNDYTYDANGNMTMDKNKSITSIEYNYLNLPNKVSKSDGKYIQYLYDATGVKLAQKVVAPFKTESFDFATPNLAISTHFAHLQFNQDNVFGKNDVLKMYANQVNTHHFLRRKITTAPKYKDVIVRAKVFIPSTNTTVNSVALAIGPHMSTTHTATDQWIDISLETEMIGTNYVMLWMLKNGRKSFVGANQPTDDLIYIKSFQIEINGHDITDYVGGYIYKNDTLQLIQHEEGRIVPNRVDNTYDYQYHLRDHLGNTRLTFTTKPKTHNFTLNYESNQRKPDDKKLFKKVDNIIHANIHDHTDAGSTYTKSQKLTGANRSIIGSVLTIPVGKGDKVSAEVYAKYLAPTNTTNPLASVGAAVIGAITGSTGASNYEGAISSSFGSRGSMISSLFSDQIDDSRPRAFINLMFLPSQAGTSIQNNHFAFTQVSSASDNTHAALRLSEYEAPASGFIVLYLSNESRKLTEVYFDDLKVTVTESKVVQRDDYYPFGLSFNSWKRSTARENKYLYQGLYAEEDDFTGWYRFKLRNNDPTIARWTTTDPYDQFASPYLSMGGNPINFIDPDGGYSKFGAWWRNGFSMKGLTQSGGEWGYKRETGTFDTYKLNGKIKTYEVTEYVFGDGDKYKSISTEKANSTLTFEQLQSRPLATGAAQPFHIEFDIALAIGTLGSGNIIKSGASMAVGTRATVQGARMGAAKGVPKYLYHYTSKGAAQSISKSGLRVGKDGFSYLTNTKNLSPIQAQIELALPANRALPNSLLRINTSGLSPVAIRRVQGNLPGLGAGGGTEFLFNQTIPSSAIKIIR